MSSEGLVAGDERDGATGADWRGLAAVAGAAKSSPSDIPPSDPATFFRKRKFLRPSFLPSSHLPPQTGGVSSPIPPPKKSTCGIIRSEACRRRRP